MGAQSLPAVLRRHPLPSGDSHASYNRCNSCCQGDPNYSHPSHTLPPVRARRYHSSLAQKLQDCCDQYSSQRSTADLEHTVHRSYKGSSGHRYRHLFHTVHLRNILRPHCGGNRWHNHQSYSDSHHHNSPLDQSNRYHTMHIQDCGSYHQYSGIRRNNRDRCNTPDTDRCHHTANSHTGSHWYTADTHHLQDRSDRWDRTYLAYNRTQMKNFRRRFRCDS